MAVSARLEQLSSKHTTLDMQIRQEMRSPMPDTMRISRLKREKLQIKDTIKDLSEAAKH